MNPIRTIRRSAAIVAALAAALLAVIAATPAAFADDVPHPGALRHPVPFGSHAHAAAAGGTPGWQIALIVGGAVLVAAAIAVLLERARAAQRRVTATAA